MHPSIAQRFRKGSQFYMRLETLLSPTLAAKYEHTEELSRDFVNTEERGKKD